MKKPAAFGASRKSTHTVAAVYVSYRKKKFTGKFLTAPWAQRFEKALFSDPTVVESFTVSDKQMKQIEVFAAKEEDRFQMTPVLKMKIALKKDSDEWDADYEVKTIKVAGQVLKGAVDGILMKGHDWTHDKTQRG